MGPHTPTSDVMMAPNENGIDDSLYSRQRYVLGDRAMKTMAASKVLLCGLGGSFYSEIYPVFVVWFEPTNPLSRTYRIGCRNCQECVPGGRETAVFV